MFELKHHKVGNWKNLRLDVFLCSASVFKSEQNFKNRYLKRWEKKKIISSCKANWCKFFKGGFDNVFVENLYFKTFQPWIRKRLTWTSRVFFLLLLLSLLSLSSQTTSAKLIILNKTVTHLFTYRAQAVALPQEQPKLLCDCVRELSLGTKVF